MQIDNMQGLYLLYALIPLIIIYMIKAKPKQFVIPSLLFFSDDKKVKKYNSLLQKLLVRLLLFVQIFMILLFAFSSAGPIINIPIDAYSLNTVAIVDISASMHTKDTHLTRYEIGRDALLKYIKGRTSIVLAEENPVVLETNITSMRAKAILSNVEPKNIPTRIDSSILLANELLGSEKGTIVVYSDFLLEKNDDILAAKKIAEANDKRVIFVSAGIPKENLAFIALNLNKGRGLAYVKNYGADKRLVDVRLKSGTKTDLQRLEIKAYSSEQIGFDVPKGETTLEIIDTDPLMDDNKLYVINPYDSKTSILFVTNKQANNPVLNALSANPAFNVKIAVPPVIPDLNFDVVIFNNVNKEMLLPNTFTEVKKFKDRGGKVILTSQEDINKIDFKGLIGFKIGEPISKDNQACVEDANSYTSQIATQSSKCFASLSVYHDISVTENNSLVIAQTTDGKPVLIVEENLFYYGIMDSFSGFSDQINYPLFWSNVIDSMFGRENLANFNFISGEIYIGDSGDKLILDTAGFIDAEGKKIAVNLLNERESDLYRQSILFNNSQMESEYEKVNMDVNLDMALLIAAALVFLFELFYIKRRGDL